jgi:hypothetical protein
MEGIWIDLIIASSLIALLSGVGFWVIYKSKEGSDSNE